MNYGPTIPLHIENVRKQKNLLSCKSESCRQFLLDTLHNKLNLVVFYVVTIVSVQCFYYKEIRSQVKCNSNRILNKTTLLNWWTVKIRVLKTKKGFLHNIKKPFLKISYF